MRKDVVNRTLHNEIGLKDNPESNEIKAHAMVDARATHNKKKYW